MPTWRKLHVKITESMDLNDMPDDFARLFWVLLPTQLCSQGRGVDNPSWARAKLFPLREDVTLAMVGAALDWFAQRGMIVRYQVEGRRYFYVPTFPKYQGNTDKEATSEYPAPLAECKTYSGASPEQVKSKSASDADADVDVDTDVDTDADASSASSSLFADELREYGNTMGLVANAIQGEEITAILEELRERNVPDWWNMALKVSADANKRSWSYMRAVLTNWLKQGYPGVAGGNSQSRASPKMRRIRVRDTITGEVVEKEVPA